jgi:geranyl-CoA carboxylase alpha subunit
VPSLPVDPAGEPLPLRQEEIRREGHAIEARLYAEDPYTGFAPQTGPVLHFRPEAAARFGVRIDAGIAEGGSVTPFYDPMVAKVIAHGRNRVDAIRRLRAALEDAPLLGPATNGRFLRDLLDHERFRSATMHTTLLDEWLECGNAIMQRPRPDEEDWQLAATILAGDPGWRPASVTSFDLTLSCGEETRKIRAGDIRAEIQLQPVEGGRLRYTQNGLIRDAIAHRDGDTLRLSRDAAVFTFSEASPFPVVTSSHDPRTARATVAGTVARIEVGAGDAVAAGQTLAVIEAMKMEMRVTASAAGTVATIRIMPGQQVAAGAILIELDIEET